MKIFLLCLAFLYCFDFATVQAAEPTTSHVAIAKVASSKLQSNQRLAIILTGNNGVLTRIVEDVLSVHLINAGFQTASREKLEQALAKRLSQLPPETGGSVGALEVGQTVGAEYVLTGTVVVEAAEGKPLLITEASVQLVNVETTETLIRAVLEWQDGGRLADLGRAVTKLLRQIKK